MSRPSYLAAISIAALLLLVPAAVAQQQQEGEEETTQDEEVVVSIRDDSFVPANAIVAPGTTVWWVNEGETPHSVTADNGLFDSGVVNPGEYYWVTFDGQGTVAYHGTPEEMAGSVTVGVGGEEAGEPAVQQQSPRQEQSTPEREREEREREPAVQQQSPSQEQRTSEGEPAVQQQTAYQERTASG
jgi:plastocyanin